MVGSLSIHLTLLSYYGMRMSLLIINHVLIIYKIFTVLYAWKLLPEVTVCYCQNRALQIAQKSLTNSQKLLSSSRIATPNLPWFRSETGGVYRYRLATEPYRRVTRKPRWKLLPKALNFAQKIDVNQTLFSEVAAPFQVPRSLLPPEGLGIRGRRIATANSILSKYS